MIDMAYLSEMCIDLVCIILFIVFLPYFDQILKDNKIIRIDYTIMTEDKNDFTVEKNQNSIIDHLKYYVFTYFYHLSIIDFVFIGF